MLQLVGCILEYIFSVTDSVGGYRCYEKLLVQSSYEKCGS
jgi:hypothetical protein